MRYLILVSMLYLLSSCASAGSCRSPKLAEKTGYRHGSQGVKATPSKWVFSNWHSMCYELNIKPNPVGYTRGYYRGLKEYCSANSSLEWNSKSNGGVAICKMADSNFCKSEDYLKALANFLSGESKVKSLSTWANSRRLRSRVDAGFFTPHTLGSRTSLENSGVITYCEAFHGEDPQKDTRFAGILEESNKNLLKNYKQRVCNTKSAYELGTNAQSYREDICVSVAFKKAYERGRKKYKLNQLAEKKRNCGADFFYRMGKSGHELSINGCDKFYSKGELVSFYRQGREDYLREKEVEAVEALQNEGE